MLYGGGNVEGIVPIAKGYLSTECWCGPIHQHTICDEALPGRYIAALAVLPAGARPVAENAIAIARTDITVVKPAGGGAAAVPRAGH